jgi:hypothetical protein
MTFPSEVQNCAMNDDLELPGSVLVLVCCAEARLAASKIAHAMPATTPRSILAI